MFKNLEILKVDEVFKFKVVKFVFQCLAQDTPSNFHTWFNVNHEIHQHGTTSNVEITRENYFDVGTVTQAKILHTKQSSLVNYGGKSLQVTGPVLWNGLPSELGNIERFNPFKYYSKKYYIDPTAQVNVGNSSTNNNPSNPRNPSGHRSRLGNNRNINGPFVSRWNLES